MVGVGRHSAFGRIRRQAWIAATTALLCGCVTDMKLGSGGSMVSGSSGPAAVASGASPEIPHCSVPLGTIALAEAGTSALTQYGLQSPLPLIRLMAAQSNCFLVVDRGQGLGMVQQEQELAQSGLLESDSDMGGGQLVAADYSVTPNVVFTEANAGGLGLLGLLPIPGAAMVGAVAGSLRFKEAQVVLFLTDNRTGVQVSAAEGSASKADLAAGGAFLSFAGAGGAGGYQNTNEGKVVAAALLDAYRKLVNQVRGMAAN